MPRSLARWIHQVLSLLVIISLLLPAGTALADSNPPGTPTPTPDVTSTPEATATNMATATEVATDAATATSVASTEAPTVEPTTTPTPEVTAAPTEAASPTTVATATTEPTQAPTAEPRPGNDQPRLSSALSDLVNSYTHGGASAASDLAQASGLSLSAGDQNVQVTAMVDPAQSVHDAKQIIGSLSGIIEAESGNLLQINLPINNLRSLAANPIFLGVRPPAYAHELAGSVQDEGVTVSGASTWQAQGLTGKGVKVAILDKGFINYTLSIGNDLPAAAKIHIRNFRADANFFTTNHGAQVAQIVYDMAPDAELWLVAIDSDLEFVEAMDWLISEKVNVINASIGFLHYAPGDGTGPLADAVNRVNAAGILYVAAAGNDGNLYASGAYDQESPITFPNLFPSLNEGPGGAGTNQSAHDWNPGAGGGNVDLYNEITPWANSISFPLSLPGTCYPVAGSLRWNDWDNNPPGEDYDLYIVRSTDAGASWSVFAGSVNNQYAGYPWPVEQVSTCIPKTSINDRIAFFVHKYNSPTGSEYLELYSSISGLEWSSSLSSLREPADTANAFTVGAYKWSDDNIVLLEPYSSQGPVNGAGGSVPPPSPTIAQIKPDITGSDCTQTTLLAEFCGTSGAAPHVAGAAALVWQAFPAFTNAQVRSYLETAAENSASDPTPNKDNQWGWGKLKLGPLPFGLLAGCTAGQAVCAGDATSWPMYQNTTSRTGSGATFSVSNLMWATQVLAATPARSVIVGPAIGATWPKGLVYVKAGTNVYALDPVYGSVIWSVNLGATTGATGQGAPAVTDYNTAGAGSLYMYVGTGDGYVVKLDAIDGDADGVTPGNQEVCRSVKVGTNLSKASPVIGADGTAYFTDDGAVNDQLIAVAPDCKLKWALTLGPGPGTSSPTYWDAGTADVADDRIFVGADRLYAITIWGGAVWFKYLNPTNPDLPPANPVPSTPLIAVANGITMIYAVNSLGELYEVNTTASIFNRVSGPMPAGVHGAGSLTAIPNSAEQFIFWTHVDKLYRYDTSAAPGTISQLQFVGTSLGDSTPVTDGSAVAIGANTGVLYRVNSSLAILPPSVNTGVSGINAGLAIAPSTPNWLLVPSADGFVRAYAATTTCAACVVEPNSDWPEFQRNQNNQGASTNFTPGSAPALLWSRNLGGDVFPPIVGQSSVDFPAGGAVEYPQGISYAVSGRYLKAIDLNTRSVIWSYDLGIAGTPLGFAAPVVSDQTNTVNGFANGVVYVAGRDGVLHAVDALTGKKVWATKIGLYDISKASPVIDNNGTVYIVEAAPINRLVAVSYEGAVRWGVNIGAGTALSAPAYDTGGGGRIFVGGDKLYCFTTPAPPTLGAACANWTASGTALGPVAGVSGAPLIVGTTVYAITNSGDLYSVPVTGGAANLLYDAPALAGSGSLALDINTLYWTLGGRLYRHNIGVGTEVFGLAGVTTNSTPVVDSAGNVFVGTSSGLFYVPRSLAGTNAVPNTNAPTGQALRTPIFTSPVLGSMAGAGAIIRSPLGGSEGILLWPSADDNLYAFGKPEAECATCGLATVQWPTYQGNAAHAPNVLNGGGPAIRESRTYVAVGAPVRAPVVDSTANNRLYFVAGSSLYARDRFSDTNLWTYNLTVPVTAGAYGMPALMLDTNRAANDQIIVLVGGSDGVLHAVRGLNGQTIWKVDVGYDISKASVVTSDSGYIFVVEDKPALIDQLVALDAKGTILWRKDIGNTGGLSTPAVNTNGTPTTGDDVVLVGGALGLYAFNVTNGNAPAGWSAAPNNVALIGAADGAPVVAAPSGVFDAYYVITKQGELARVISDTNYEILADVPGTGKSGAPYARLNGGVTESVFFGVGNTLYQYVMADGTLRSLILGGDLGDSTPLAGDNAIYIASSDGKFYSVNDLTTLNSIAWASVSSVVSMAGPGAFIDNGTVVWPSQNGRLRVFENGGGSGSIAVAGQWPFAQGNDARTGTSAAALNTSVAEELAVLGAGDAKPPVIGDVNQPLPTYTQGVAYFTAGTKVYALDLNARLVVQSWDMGAGNMVTGNAAPAVATSGGTTRVFVVDNNGNVRAYGGDAGGWKTAPLWVTDVGLNVSNASPIVRNNLVYVVESAGTVRVHALNMFNGSIVWTATLGAGSGASAPAFYDSLPDRLFVGADKLYSINANTGSILWSRTLNGPVAATPLVVDNTGTANDYVMALTTTGGLYRIPVTGGSSAPTPVANIVGGVNTVTSLAAFQYSAGNFYIFFALGSKLYRLDTATNTLFSPTGLALGVSPTNFYNSSPIVDNSGDVYIGGGDGFLYGVNGNTMAVLTPAYSAIDGTGWPKPVGAGNATSAVTGTLALDVNNRLYVPSIDDNLRRYALTPGVCGCGLYTAAQWPMFQHDPGHSGRNNQPTAEGHRTPLTLKTFTQITPIIPPRTAVLGPVTGANPKGVLYYTSGRYLVARDANSGAVLWQYDMGLTGGPSALSGASPALLLRAANGGGTDDDTVWVIVGGSDGYLNAVNAADGKMVWRIDLGLDISKSSPAIGSDGTIYVLEDAVGADRLHAVYWNGMRRWTRVLDSATGSGASSPTLDGTNVYVSSGNKVYAFNALTGAIASGGWPTAGTVGGVTIPLGLVNTTTLLKASDAGNPSDVMDLWVVNSSGAIYNIVAGTGFLTDGNLNPAVKDPIYQGVGAVSDGVAPAVQYDPFTKVDIIVYTAGMNLYRVRWTAPDSGPADALLSVSFIPTTATLGSTSPVIDDNGWSYVLDSLGYLRAMYRYGPAWVYVKKVATQGTSVGGILVANDGTLYVPSRNNSIYVVGKP